jgi:hypothetical protein
MPNPFWAYVVLAVAAMFESVSFTVATRERLRLRGPPHFWLRVRLSKDPAVFFGISRGLRRAARPGRMSGWSL